MALRLEKFDPSRDFVTAGAFRAGGTTWGKGFPFDKDCVNVHVLKRLYEQHKLVYAESEKAKKLLTRSHRAVVKTPAAVAPTDNKATEELASNPNITDEAQAAADAEDKAVDKLVKGHSKAELLKKASGIAGITQGLNKTEIARAMVRHGRTE